MASYQKSAIHLYINQYVGIRLADVFFYYITYFGDGRIAFFILLTILLYNVRLGLYATFSFLSATIVSTSCKYLYFDGENRPFFFYSYIEKTQLKLVEGVDMHIHNSFPSGHATQAFSILMVLAFVTPKKWMKVLLLLLALLTSLSRVYLSQHWLIDITAGSLIGMACSIGWYYYFIHRNKFVRLNKSLNSLRSA